jgi:hypothetical protein
VELTMSMFPTQADYWQARAEQAENLVSELADKLGIGSEARTPEVILSNVENAVRRSACLSQIEHFHTYRMEDEEGEESEEQLLNWGDSPEDYIKNYKVVVPQPCSSDPAPDDFPLVRALEGISAFFDNEFHLIRGIVDSERARGQRSGQRQEEECRPVFDHCFVHQDSGGHSGDDFHGTVYFFIGDDQYLAVEY